MQKYINSAEKYITSSFPAVSAFAQNLYTTAISVSSGTLPLSALDDGNYLTVRLGTTYAVLQYSQDELTEYGVVNYSKERLIQSFNNISQ